jgi:hypothetical protein
MVVVVVVGQTGCPVCGNHVEARSTSGAYVHLSESADEPTGAEPLAEGIRIGPRSEHRFACGVKNSNEDERRVGSDKAAKTTSNRSGAVTVIVATAAADTS